MFHGACAICFLAGRWSEVETLAHVLGSCPFGETLRNSGHHKIMSVIATCLKSNGYTTYEEVHGIADTGSQRRIDIITFKPGEKKKRYILDPTIRFETHQNQPEETFGKRTKEETSEMPYVECGLYGEETWTLRRSEEKRLQAFEMWIWRRMDHVNWTDGIRNEAVGKSR
ncbi:hypothetical protein ANN_03018 [Periplaneta americana]|uniref:Uncharacterized protein n=1 Tax=Periplaneta americana TaxID=6978 RepID=A0ABQ8TZJ4_PERAM|nr:hypothetical protein ANN_03018 [Periplaneta americana]